MAHHLAQQIWGGQDFEQSLRIFFPTGIGHFPSFANRQAPHHSCCPRNRSLAAPDLLILSWQPVVKLPRVVAPWISHGIEAEKRRVLC
jgi:hypothetical protein